MTVTIEINEALSIKLWPKWNRAAVIGPFNTTTLSIDELLKAIKKARRERTKEEASEAR